MANDKQEQRTAFAKPPKSLRVADSASHHIGCEMASEIRCPFCGDTGFDLLGLKMHLVRGWCEEFGKVGA